LGAALSQQIFDEARTLEVATDELADLASCSEDDAVRRLNEEQR
jgi:hypothetical protein